MSTAATSDDYARKTLTENKKRHVALMRQSLEVRDSSGLGPSIVEFVKHTSELGTRLGAGDERADAQYMLDYWNSTLFALTKGTLEEGVPTELQSFSADQNETGTPGENPFGPNSRTALLDPNWLLGREDSIQTVIRALSEHPIVFISGPVGSGRSSLIMAGVAPRLAKPDAPPKSKSSTPLKIFSVSLHDDDPIRSLGKIVARSAAFDLSRSQDNLREQIDKMCGEGAALLVVDNADELFTSCTEPERREAFAKALASLAREPRQHFVILIVRDDWAEALYKLDAFKPYAVDAARYSPPPPTASEIRAIVQGLVQRAGLRIHPDCVEDLARELQSDPGALSLIRFMLLHLWPLRKGGFIGLDAYRQLGGRPYEALAHIADDAYTRLSDKGQAAAKRLFTSLVKPGLSAGVVCLRKSRRALDVGGRDTSMLEALHAFEKAGVIRESAPTDSNDDSLHGDRARQPRISLANSDWVAG